MNEANKLLFYDILISILENANTKEILIPFTMVHKSHRQRQIIFDELCYINTCINNMKNAFLKI